MNFQTKKPSNSLRPKNNKKIEKIDRRCFGFALIAKTELTARDNMRFEKAYGVSSRKKPRPAQHDFPMMSDCSRKFFLKTVFNFWLSLF